jgi:hypothetical protein
MKLELLVIATDKTKCTQFQLTHNINLVDVTKYIYTWLSSRLGLSDRPPDFLYIFVLIFGPFSSTFFSHLST